MRGRNQVSRLKNTRHFKAAVSFYCPKLYLSKMFLFSIGPLHRKELREEFNRFFILIRSSSIDDCTTNFPCRCQACLVCLLDQFSTELCSCSVEVDGGNGWGFERYTLQQNWSRKIYICQPPMYFSCWRDCRSNLLLYFWSGFRYVVIVSLKNNCSFTPNFL